MTDFEIVQNYIVFSCHLFEIPNLPPLSSLSLSFLWFLSTVVGGVTYDKEPIKKLQWRETQRSVVASTQLVGEKA